ncbi:hypothetical protein RFI_38395, partial [Reticulomyxa filosa]
MGNEDNARVQKESSDSTMHASAAASTAVTSVALTSTSTSAPMPTSTSSPVFGAVPKQKNLEKEATVRAQLEALVALEPAKTKKNNKTTANEKSTGYNFITKSSLFNTSKKDTARTVATPAAILVSVSASGTSLSEKHEALLAQPQKPFHLPRQGFQEREREREIYLFFFFLS